MDHEPGSEDVERDGDPKRPLETACAADCVADNEEEDSGYDLECAVYVAGVGDGEVVDYLQEGGEVGGPAVVGHLVDHID